MLKLISCELQKLKRKKFIPFVVLSAFLFPPPLALMMLTPRMMDRYDTKAELFDDFYQFVLGYGVELLLPCIIGVIAAWRGMNMIGIAVLCCGVVFLCETFMRFLLS